MFVNHNVKNIVMIPMLILYLLKKVRVRQSNWLELLNFKIIIKRVIAILSLLVITSFCKNDSNGPLAFNHYPKMPNDCVNVKIIKTDWNHFMCKYSILI